MGIEATVKPNLTANIYGLIGRGVKEVQLNEKGELLFIMTDGNIINLGVISGGGGSYILPIATEERLGGIKVGNNLSITKEGVLSVDTASDVIEDNTKPITSGAVYTEIGNIEVLLQNI